jgi:anti-sigma-K factor RskA
MLHNSNPFWQSTTTAAAAAVAALLLRLKTSL